MRPIATRSASALALMLGTAPVFAQSPARAATEDEIVVTAQKREERLIDVPISISVQDGDVLKASGINDFLALQARVPNLVIVDTPANKSVTIRGIGTSGNSYSFEQSVALFVDGVYGGRNRQFNQPFLDVERVEVLRGPQGALFGRNTSAGAISILSKRPEFRTGGEVSGEYEFATKSFNVTGIANAPLSDTLAIRLTGKSGLTNGFLYNTTLDRREPVRSDQLARASLLWTPSDQFSLYAKLDYSRSNITGSSFEFAAGGTLPDYRKDADDAFAPERDASNTLNAVVQIDVGLGTHTLTTIAGYSRYDYDQAFNIQARRPARLVVVNSERFRQFSQEVRIASPSEGAFNYVVGAYVERGESRVARASIFDFPPPPSPDTQTFRTFNQDTDVIAAFAQGALKFGQFTIAGGIRWTQIKKSGDLAGFSRPGGGPPVFRAPLAASFSESDFAPSATLSWAPDRNTNVYVKYAKGNKGGALSEFQNATLATFILRPEKADAFEAGAKLAFPSIGGFFNIAVFTTDYTDLQKSALDVNTASFVTSNAAGARTRGVELEAGVRPVEGLRLTGSIAYLSSKYLSWPNGPCRFDNPAKAIPGCTQNRAGDPLQSAPEWSGSVNLGYDAPVGATVRLFAAATVNFQSDINYQETLSPLEVQPAFAKADLRFGVGGVDRNWDVALLVRNLFDKRTSQLIFETFPVGIGPNDRVYVPDLKRTFTLQARMKF